MSSRIKDDVQKIFEFWCELRQDKGAKTLAVLIECFPESYRDSEVIAKIPEFAFPCEFENTSVQTYSFVSTSDDSKFRFGFCRHDPKMQTAMVLITYLPWHDTFFKLMAVLSELRRNKNGEFESFLSEAYNKGIPERGSSLKLFYNSGQNHFTFQRPSQFELPSIPENHNLNLYYNFVDPKNMIAVFAAMLSERRIIFTSRRLDRLSSCIQAASAFLYPMIWQHIFIPILPMKMKDVLCAPMPYLIGVPETVLRTMTAEELGEVVVLNCDNNEFTTPFDDARQMPPELICQMKKHLSNSNELIGDRISKIFLRVLVQLIGGYRDAAKYSQGQKITWDRDTFIESRSPNLRNFLSRMMELQIFQQFIDERLDILNSGQGISDEFEMETLRYTDKMGKKGKNYRDFLRNVKDKTNPAVKSAVKSVKEGSRGVKTAYKDLKSKLRDITPPKTQFHISPSSPNDADGADFIQRHHSAPNSPVFFKRGVNTDISLEDDQQPYSSYTQSSNSLLMNGRSDYSNQNVMYSNNNINIGSFNSPINKSPTISPSTSLSSSDMNISQELQNHPLFKSTYINRSLKPSNSLEYAGLRIAPRLGPSATKPTEIELISASAKGSTSKGKMFEINTFETGSDTTNAQSETMTLCKASIFSVDTIFDSPPDMPAPPVPPKRRNGSCANGSRVQNSPKHTEIHSKSGHHLVANHFSSPSALENNYMRNKSTTSAVITGAYSTHSVSNRRFPIPVPRNRPEELAKLEADMTKDLISLDENSSSFDLSDLDPLNQNAKPIPCLSQSIQLPSTSNCILGISNPLYPQFTPRIRMKGQTIENEIEDSESELLRQYGLDKFRLTNSGTVQKTDSKSTWTTFD